MKLHAHLLAPDGAIPNHPRWPLLVYPGAVDTCVPPLARHGKNVERIAAVPLPACDPVHGTGGPLFKYWKAV